MPPNNAISTTPTYQLSANDRIAVLEAELFNLKTRKGPIQEGPHTRSQKARGVTIEDVENESKVAAARAQLRTPRIEEVEEPSAPQRNQEFHARTQEHPFRSAKDAAYTPPSSKNVGAQDKTPSVPYKKAEPAYKTLPPVHSPAITASVSQRSMEAPITITQKELLSLSPEVCSQVRDATMTRCIPNRDPVTMQNLYKDQEDLYTDSLTTTFVLSDAYNRPILQDTFIVEDEIENYYRSLGAEEDPELGRLIVSGDSSAIHSIHTLVDNSHCVKCILDLGCQIIAMSEVVCHTLGLAYDPSIVLHMQSANGMLDQSLGLSRNVPFTIGKITMYLQVHVISSPAYDVLLG